MFGIMYVVPIALAYTVEEYWLGDDPIYSFLYLIFAVTWIGLAVLMTLEQERHLTQAWYCHQFFWVTNCLFVVVFSCISFAKGIYPKDDYAAYTFSALEMLLSLLTVAFMMKTKSLRLRRLEERMQAPNSVNSEKMLPKIKSPGTINITMEYRINKKNDDKLAFKIVAGKLNTRVKRSFNEFLQIEDYLLKYADSKMPELRSLIPAIEKVPKMSSSMVDHATLYESRLRSIDRFLQVISEMPELWSRDVLIFLGIDKASDQSLYLQKRNE